MLVALSDTHRESGHGLSGVALDAVRDAEVVCHAGDFTTPAVHESFREEADRFEAVHGNSDASGLRDRLPPKRVFVHGGRRILLVHGHEHGGTALSMLARQADADLVISGHTHRPRAVVREGRIFLNPGSHARPRGARAAFARVRFEEELRGDLVGVDGDPFESFSTS